MNIYSLFCYNIQFEEAVNKKHIDASIKERPQTLLVPSEEKMRFHFADRFGFLSFFYWGRRLYMLYELLIMKKTNSNIQIFSSLLSSFFFVVVAFFYYSLSCLKIQRGMGISNPLNNNNLVPPMCCLLHSDSICLTWQYRIWYSLVLKDDHC